MLYLFLLFCHIFQHGKTPVTRTYSAPLRSAASYGLTMTSKYSVVLWSSLA